MTPSAKQLADVFVDLAGASLPASPAGEAGLLDLLVHHSVDLLDGCTAAAVRVHTRDGVEVAGSGRAMHRLELDAADWEEGPGHDSEGTNASVEDAQFSDPVICLRWPRYVARAGALGLHRVTALPLRTEERLPGLGSLTLLGRSRLTAAVLGVGQSLADMAAITLERNRQISESRVRGDQLEHALTSRVLIEQAKGVLSGRLSIPPDSAFTLLRDHARANRRLLNDVARDVISGRLTLHQESSPVRERRL
ncbi:ANTAR domain-containing protein [Streptomyces sp. NPDC041068]|uniref:ANTAR domain-containing protein n=1 Tax=Streptomyces sp. NPDC041068 TaxID=3155130 RepID=UPI0033D8A6A4